MSESTQVQEVSPAPSTQPSPAPHTTSSAPHFEGELSGAATAGISTAIGVGNVCCGPVCYCMPSLVSTAVGVILYLVWKDEKPKTAKTILIVTVITAGVALLFAGIIFMLGFAGAIIDAANY